MIEISSGPPVARPLQHYLAGETMRGFITEQHFEQAEREFPGIRQLYLSCEVKPRTFLDLVTHYLRVMASRLQSQKQAA